MLQRIVMIAFLCIYSHLVFANNAFTERYDVQSFIKHMVLKYHFNQAQLISIFNAVKIRPAVIKQVKAPLEQQPWYLYRNLFLTEARIHQGVNFWNQHAAVLAEAEKKYGVPARIIVATLGVETKYGQHIGEYPVIDALANIAFSSSSRAGFFKSELTEFLLLCREQHLNPLTVMGSYAGAIGQPQFMPSSYRNYGVSFHGNSKVDLTHDVKDTIFSIANYYHKHGWKWAEPVATPVTLQGYRYQHLENNLQQGKLLPVSTLIEYGIVPKINYTGTKKVKLIELKGYSNKEYWLGFQNFDVIKRYNPSNLYAMTVYQLGYYIAASREKSNHA